MGKSTLAKFRERHKGFIEAKFAREGQPPIDGKYWIVRRVSLPSQYVPHFSGVAMRHPTIDAAKLEAERLAERNPSETFGVFEFTGVIRKVEISSVEQPCVTEPVPV